MHRIEQVFSIIRYLSKDNLHHGVTEISKDLGIPKSSVHRFLSSMEKLQWIAKDPSTEKYRLGYAALEIGLSMMSQLDIRNVSLPYLTQLCDSINETTMLSLRVGLERIFIEQVPDNNEIRLVAKLGMRAPLWCGAQGKVILANMEQSEIEAVLDDLKESAISVLASGQGLEINGLRKQLLEIRSVGFAVSVGERVVGGTAVAAPVFGSHNRILGAISVGGPVQRFSGELAKSYGPAVREAARKISVQLGAFGEGTQVTEGVIP